MAKIIDASDIQLKVNGTLFGCSQAADITISREMNDVVCQATGAWGSKAPGLKTWSASLNAYFREFVTADGTQIGIKDLYDALDDGVLVTVEFTNTAGATKMTGSAYVSELKFSKPDKSSCTYSVSLQGEGAFTIV